jgi:hypothetical protein
MTEEAPRTPRVADDVLRVAEAVHADEVTVAFNGRPRSADVVALEDSCSSSDGS